MSHQNVYMNGNVTIYHGDCFDILPIIDKTYIRKNGHGTHRKVAEGKQLNLFDV